MDLETRCYLRPLYLPWGLMDLLNQPFDHMSYVNPHYPKMKVK